MIYLDNAATYISDNQDVLDVFLKASKDFKANTNSSHRLGYLANRELTKAQDEVIKCLYLDNSYEVIFTSGATESINLAIKGYVYRNKTRGNEIIAFKNEHPAVIESLDSLAKDGFIIHYVNPDSNGVVNYDEIKKLINQKTIMVVTMSVNNETGSINDLNKVHEIVKGYPKCVFFGDVTQSITKVKEDYKVLDMFACSAHKFGGVIGSGLLVKKKKIILEKLMSGGSQQNNLRGGTVPLPLILSTTHALKKMMGRLEANYKLAKELYQKLDNSLSSLKNEIKVNSTGEFPYIFNFSLNKKKASVVIEALSNKEIYVSTKSACNEKTSKPSYVLTNMGISSALAENSIRVSFSNINTVSDIEIFAKELSKIIEDMR